MKRFAVPLAVMVMAMMPIVASAATLASGQQYLLPVQQQVSDDLYVAAGTATIAGDAAEDVFAVGGTIALTGSVGGDAAIFGGTIQLLGPVTGDVRVAGGTISANEHIGGDMMVAGGTVHLLSGARVQGDLIVAGGQVVIDGIVDGAVRMAGGQLTINGTVNGNVSARADKEIIMGSSAHVGGTVSYTGAHNPAPKTGKTNMAFPIGAMLAMAALITGMKMIAFLGLGVLLVWVWRKQSLELFSDACGSFWSTLGKGFAYAILVPIAAILLLISFVGTLAGVIAILVYIIAWIFASVMAGMFLGSWVVKVFKKNAAMKLTWWSGLLGIILLGFISMIPFIGWIVVKVLGLLMFGAIAHAVHRFLESR
jgi:hypothetical protein